MTGPGGCGKTRLAIRAAGEMGVGHKDGTWLTEFAPLGEADLVPQAVAATLSVREQTGRSMLASLVDFLRSRKTLLVLDNCEHLVAACAQLSARLLESCPGVRILATSQEPLGVPGEAVWLVPPLFPCRQSSHGAIRPARKKRFSPTSNLRLSSCSVPAMKHASCLTR